MKLRNQLCGVPILESCFQHAGVEPKSALPLSNGSSLSIYCQVVVIVAVVGLFFFGSPSAVFGGVPDQVVNPVEGMRCARLFSYVADKCPEIVPPSITNSYTYSSISWITGIGCVVAPIHHAVPSVVQGVSSFSVSNAPAACDASGVKVSHCNLGATSAVAFAQPFSAQLLNGGQFPKPLPGDCMGMNCNPVAPARGGESANKIAYEEFFARSAVASANPFTGLNHVQSSKFSIPFTSVIDVLFHGVFQKSIPAVYQADRNYA